MYAYNQALVLMAAAIILFSSFIITTSWDSISSVFLIYFSSSYSDFYRLISHYSFFSYCSIRFSISTSRISFSSPRRFFQNLSTFSLHSI